MVIPWGVFQWVVDHPELGWVLLFGWLLFELRSKRGRIYALDKKITGAIIVIRALAQQESAINEDKVDDYLVENGMEPNDFFKEDQSAPAQKMVEDSALTTGESSISDNDNSPNNDERSTE